MHKSWLLATTMLALGIPQAMAASPPAPAAAVGYTTQTFGPGVTLGQNWLTNVENGTAVNATQSPAGVTIAGGGDTWNAQLKSAAAFGGGLYAQATISVPGATSGLSSWTGGSSASEWPSWWANTTDNAVETDFMEMMGGTPGEYGATVHNWTAGYSQGYGQSIQAPSGNTLNGSNTYGFLWIPATATTPGSMSFYLNNQPVGKPITWTQANPGLYGILDSRQMVLRLGAGANSPMTVTDVQVWQGKATNNGIVGSPPSGPQTLNLPPGPFNVRNAAVYYGPASTVSSPTSPVSSAVSGSVTTNTALQVSATGPDAKPFMARGINVGEEDLATAAGKISAAFPCINFIRVPVTKGAGGYPAPGTFADAVKTLTGQSIVVEFEDHSSNGSAIPTGQALADELAWETAMAATYVGNGFVWLGMNNAPSSTMTLGAQPDPTALATWQTAQYNAIRVGGKNPNPILLAINQNVDAKSFAQGYPADTYGKMVNVVANIPFYGSYADNSTDQAVVSQFLTDAATATQKNVVSKDGTIPVIVGDYGNSTDGTKLDANWRQAVTAVTSFGMGSSASAWGMGTPGNGLNRGDGYGQQVAAAISNAGAAAGCVVPPGTLPAIMATTGQASSASGDYAGTTSDPTITVTDQSVTGDQPSTYVIHVPTGSVPATGTDGTVSINDSTFGTKFVLSGLHWTGLDTASSNHVATEAGAAFVPADN